MTWTTVLRYLNLSLIHLRQRLWPQQPNRTLTTNLPGPHFLTTLPTLETFRMPCRLAHSVTCRLITLLMGWVWRQILKEALRLVATVLCRSRRSLQLVRVVRQRMSLLITHHTRHFTQDNSLEVEHRDTHLMLFRINFWTMVIILRHLRCRQREIY